MPVRASSPFVVAALLLVACVVLGWMAVSTPRSGAGSTSATAAQPELPAAVEQWHALRGGAPDATTPLAAPARTLTVRELLVPQRPRRSHRIYRTRPIGFAPAAIVLHATGGGTPGSGFGTVEELGRFFARGAVQASAHYGVGRDGRIARYVAEADAAFHVATPGWNDISIGIELLNDNSGTDPYPPAQLEAARLLVQDLAARHGIPLEAVVTHSSVQPSDRRDPVAFPWERWRASLLR